MKNLQEFRAFLVPFISGIVTQVDSSAKAAQAKNAELSATIADMSQTIADLRSALDGKDKAKSDALMDQAEQQSIGLADLAQELNDTFNPTPAADAVAEAVKAAPEIATPELVEASETLGTPEPTEAVVVDAAIEAVALSVATV